MNYNELKQQIKDYLETTETTFVNNIDLFIKSAEERIFEELELNLFRKSQTASFSTGNRFLTLPDDYLNSISIAAVVDGDYVYLRKKHPSFMQDHVSDPSDSILRGIPRYYADYDAELQTSTSVGSTIVVSPVPDTTYSVELEYYYKPLSITDLSVFRSVTLGGDPLTTGSAGSNVVTVSDSSHGANNQSLVTLASADATDGIAADVINTTHKTFNVATNSYDIKVNSSDTTVVSGASSGSTSGGGSSITAVYVSGGHSWIGTNAETALLYGCLAEGYSFLKGESALLQYYEQRYQSEIARLKNRYSGRNRLEERRHDSLRTAVQ